MPDSAACQAPDDSAAFGAGAQAGAQGANAVILSACLVERDVLRYTPAGVPVMQCMLAHRSVQQEAGIGRQLEFEVRAVGLAEMAHRLEQLQPGTLLTATGFLAPSRKGSRMLVLHLTRIDLN